MATIKPKIIKDENGFASLVIAVILILVMSLTTIGFAELMRKETRSATDRHLSSQAFYAAETGINDAEKAIEAGYGADGSGKPNCKPLEEGDTEAGAQYLKPNKNNVGTEQGVSYTCLLINPTPDKIVYTVGGQSKTMLITGVSSANPSQKVEIREMIIGWTAKEEGNQGRFQGIGAGFKTASQWGNSTGVLRLGLTPLHTTNINRDALINDTYTAFLYPFGRSTSAQPEVKNYADSRGDTGGSIHGGNCHRDNPADHNLPGECNVKITGLNSANYLLSLRSIYTDLNVKIFAYDVNGQRVLFDGVQTVIDSTGKAQDVLRRIQVYKPNRNSLTKTDFGLETTGSICKQLQIAPGSDSGSNVIQECRNP